MMFEVENYDRFLIPFKNKECPKCGEDLVCGATEEDSQARYCPKCNIRYYSEIDILAYDEAKAADRKKEAEKQ